MSIVMWGLCLWAVTYVKLQMGCPSCPHPPISWQYDSLTEAVPDPRTWQYKFLAGQ